MSEIMSVFQLIIYPREAKFNIFLKNKIGLESSKNFLFSPAKRI